MSQPQSGQGLYSRPKITISGGVFLHNGSSMRVVFRRSGMLSVGCSDVSIAALREMVNRYDKWQTDEEYVLQP